MERTHKLLTALSWTVASGLLLGFAGCSTSLVGGSYDYSKNDGRPLSGVPFTLNKPLPKVTHTVAADTGKETYQVGFDWVTDSTRRYTLQIKPTALASVDFTMTFDAGGSLTETSAKSTDQTGQLIATVGKLALLSIGDKSADVPQTYNNVLALGDEYAVKTSSTTAWTPIKARFLQLGTTSKIQSDYVYDDTPQMNFLHDFLADLRNYTINPKTTGVHLPRNDGYDTFKDALDAFNAKFAAVADKAFAKEIEDSFARGEIKKLKDKKTELVAALETHRVAFASSKTTDAQDRVNAVLAKVKLLNAAIKNTRPEIALMADVAEMSLADWQRRAIAPVVKDITAKQQQVRVAEASGQPASLQRALNGDLESLQRKKASILGVLPEFDRRQFLTRRLEREGTAKDLKSIREERDALDVTIAAAEPAKQKAKAAVADDPAVAAYIHEDLSPADLTSDQVLNRLDADLKGIRPRYVIVVRDAASEKGAVTGYIPPPAVPAGNQPEAPQPNQPVKPGGKVGDLDPPVPPPPPPKVSMGNGSNGKKD